MGGCGEHGLHCFEKKSQKTAQADIDIATRRFRALTRGAS
ncbi:type II toxin-antitoxin system RelE/ParE family toxin [Niveispirillum sp.]|nr:type II toxin-antitoxin system RelE/ParE family toxin [Niveispirillum sp.]